MAAKPANHVIHIDVALRDGYEVHCAALERGMDVTLLPRQVLMVGRGNPIVGDASFVHGVPQSSSLSGVTFAQDKRVRRALLEREGFTVPRGATFSIGHSAKRAMAFAERIGFPVVAKPTMGDNAVGAIPSIRSRGQLEEAIEYFHTPFEDREDFVRASYAMTELREPGLRDGMPVAPPSYRFLIERQISGQYIRLLVVDGTVRNAVFCPSGPSEAATTGVQDVTALIHPTITEYAVAAARVIPGLSVVAIDLVVPDFHTATGHKDIHIVEYSERPWLALQDAHSKQLVQNLAEQLLRYELRGKPTLAFRELIEVEVRIDGAVAPEAFKEACAKMCAELGLESSLMLTDAAIGEVTGRLRGSARMIAWLIETALEGGIEGYRAMLAELRVR
jgi:hypothetical protein